MAIEEVTHFSTLIVKDASGQENVAFTLWYLSDQQVWSELSNILPKF